CRNPTMANVILQLRHLTGTIIAGSLGEAVSGDRLC
ncbi:MAG: hypothetical protein ACI87E_004228, partial [Mariniblastus sp.]